MATNIVPINATDLEPTELKEFLSEYEENSFEQCQDFVSKRFVQLATFYASSLKSSQEKGAVVISGEFGSNDDEDYILWSYWFTPFSRLMADTESSKFADSIRADDPYNMTLVFLHNTAQGKFWWKDRWIKHDGCISITFHHQLDKAVDEVVKDQSDRKAFVKKPIKKEEQKLEYALYDWLRVKGYEVEKQVVTVKHRLDLWLPDKAMIELKQGRVSGDDVCQAIDYSATYKMPIILVGTGLSSAASRGIDGYNRSLGNDAIMFVTWGAIKPYILGAFSLIK